MNKQNPAKMCASLRQIFKKYGYKATPKPYGYTGGFRISLGNENGQLFPVTIDLVRHEKYPSYYKIYFEYDNPSELRHEVMMLLNPKIASKRIEVMSRVEIFNDITAGIKCFFHTGDDYKLYNEQTTFFFTFVDTDNSRAPLFKLSWDAITSEFTVTHLIEGDIYPYLGFVKWMILGKV